MKDYDTDNRIAARVILADPVRYAGGLLIWAIEWARAHGLGEPKTGQWDLFK